RRPLPGARPRRLLCWSPSAPRRMTVVVTSDARARLLEPTRRALRAPQPEVHRLMTSDGVQLRLTRYRGGPRGPILLAHGLSVSSRIFTTDTIATNLLEFLCAHGFDVWLIDLRVSIDL